MGGTKLTSCFHRHLDPSPHAERAFAAPECLIVVLPDAGFVPLWEIIQDPQGEVFKVPPELATRQPFNAIVMLVGVYQDFKKGPNGFEPLPGVAVRAGAGFCLGRNTVLTCAHFGTCSVSPKLGTVGLLLDGVAFAAMSQKRYPHSVQ